MLVIRNVFVDPNLAKPSVPGAQEQSMFMSIAVGLFAAVGGFIFGYDTGLINSLIEMQWVRQHFASTPGHFSANESSFTTAILSLGTFTGAICAPLLSDTLGRRVAIIIATFVVFMIGNICQIASTGLTLLCIGRFITGVSVGIISAVVPVYQAEASPKYARGAIISTYQWTITWGLLVASAVSQGTQAMNSSASYRIPIGLQFIWSLILGIGMIYLPETPRFYVKKDDLYNAAISLSRLRRVPTDDPGLIEELVEIKAAFDYEISFSTGKNKFKDFFQSDEARPHQVKRILTGVLLQAFQQCSGINFIFYYGVNFFSNTGVSKSYLISFVTYAVNVVATVPGIVLVETVGRRKVLIVGGTVMGCANLVIAIVGVTTNSVIANKVMIAFVCLFISSFAASWAPVVWVVCGEIFSLHDRGKAVALTAATNWLVNFVFAYITPYLVDQGNHTAALGTKIFFIWGGFNLIGALFAYFVVYETRGLSLEHIDELYRQCPNAINSAGFKVRLKFTAASSGPNLSNSDNDEDYNNNTEENGLSLESYQSINEENKQNSANSDYMNTNDYQNNNNNDNYNNDVTNNEENISNIEKNEYSTQNMEYKDYAINLGYGLGLAGQNRGPPSLLTMTTDGSTSINEENIAENNDYSLSEFVDHLSSGNDSRDPNNQFST